MRVGPLALERLDQALDLAVPARGVGRGEDVAQARGRPRAAREGASRAGRRPPRRSSPPQAAMPSSREVGQGPVQEGRAGLGALVGELLDVGIAAVVVDGDVEERPSRRRGCAGARRGRGCDGPGRSKRARRAVSMWIRAPGRRPLIAAAERPRLARQARDARPVEHLPDRRAGPPEHAGQAPRAQVGLGPGARRCARCSAGRQQARAAVRAGSSGRPGRRSEARPGRVGARPSGCHQRWAVAGATPEGRRGGPHRVALLDQADQLCAGRPVRGPR